MKQAARRIRSDSVGAVVAAAKTRAPLDVPPHLTLKAGARPYWSAIIGARLRDEWTEVDLVIACQLAECQAAIETEAATLDQEGAIVAGKANPRATILDLLIKRQMALMRTLRMGGVAAGRREALEPARRLEQRMKAEMQALFDEDPHELIAR